jgi:hypothetical protein
VARVESRGHDLAVRIDEAAGGVTYIGYAEPGRLDNEAAWQIFRLTETGQDLEKEYADGNDEFNKVWDDRASLSYS